MTTGRQLSRLSNGPAPSSMSPSRSNTSSSLDETRKALATLDHLKVLTVVTPAQAMAVLEADDQELTACQSIEANRLAKQLKGLCPPHETLDQAMFAAGLTALFCEYPYEIVETVCHPARGLPRTQKFGLKIADVEEALSIEVRRRANILAAARYVIDTAARIAAEKAPEPKYISVERRQELVKQLRARAM